MTLRIMTNTQDIPEKDGLERGWMHDENQGKTSTNKHIRDLILTLNQVYCLLHSPHKVESKLNRKNHREKDN